MGSGLDLEHAEHLRLPKQSLAVDDVCDPNHLGLSCNNLTQIEMNLSTRWNNRRSFLCLGGLLPWGMSLAPWLARGDAFAATTPVASAKSCILLWLDGGPSHLEMWDPKTDAPSEVRGPFDSIATSLPGAHFSENLRRLSTLAHRMTIIRSMTSPLGEHGLANNYMLTGYQPSPSLEYPSIGSIVAHQRTPKPLAIPPYIGIPEQRIGMGSGFLGDDAAPFVTGGSFTGGDPVSSAFHVRDLDFYPGIDAVRFQRRRELLSQLEARDRVDTRRGTAMDLANEMVSSPMAKEAFNLQREPASVRERYGNKTFGQSCLLARRLVERNVPFVTVVQTGWDTHENLALTLRDGYSGAKIGVGLIPTFDQAASALIEDLERRGLLDQTLVVAMGEFGRTPKLNPRGGRDHWPRVFSVMLCGGGTPQGFVLGQSDRVGESPTERPITPADLARTIIARMGIDPDRLLQTTDGRPIPINQYGKLISELL